MKRDGRSHSVDTVFVLSLFCVFAAAVLMTLIFGTKIHSAMKRDSNEAYYSRTALSYITEKLRHCDNAGCVKISAFADSSSIELTEAYNGVEYETIIYVYNGSIRELFCEKSMTFDPGAGAEIIKGQGLTFTFVSDRLIRIDYTDTEGKSSSAFAYLRSGGAA